MCYGTAFPGSLSSWGSTFQSSRQLDPLHKLTSIFPWPKAVYSSGHFFILTTNLSKVYFGCNIISLRSEICRVPRNWIRCTHHRTILDHLNAFIWGLRRAILKFASRKVGRKFFPINSTGASPQGNALLWSQFVLAWVQRMSIFGSSDHRL